MNSPVSGTANRYLLWSGIGLLVGSTLVIGWGNSLAVN